MKKNMLILGLLVLMAISSTNCSKDGVQTNQETLLGTWISIDKNDTLDFTTNTDFYKSNGYMVYDHYDYELYKDSIEIGYIGKLYIRVSPTMHKYQLTNGILTLDLGNEVCHGFESKLMKYKKEL